MECEAAGRLGADGRVDSSSGASLGVFLSNVGGIQTSAGHSWQRDN